MWRFHWIGLAVTWVLFIVGCAWILMMPNVYKANAVIYVDTDSALEPLLQGLAVNVDPYEELAVITEALLSRPNLSAVAKVAGLDAKVSSSGDLEGLLTEMGYRIQIVTLRGKRNLFEISYTDPNRETARIVVFELLNTFMSNTLGFNSEDTSSVQNFLDKQIEEYEVRLTESEERLADFKRDNVGLMPGESGGYYERLERESGIVKSLEQELSVAVDRRDELARQLTGEEPSLGLGNVIAGGAALQTQYDSRILLLESQMDELLLRYTENHPSVVSLRQTLDNLEKQRDEERRSLAGLGITGGASLADDPVYQDMQINLNAANVEIAELRSKLRNQKNIVKELRNLVDTLPDVETSLVQLNRNYDVTKQRYTELLNRRESARLTSDVGFSEMASQFRLLEPTKALVDPVGPNRPLLITVLLVGCFGFGLAITFFLSQLKPVCASIPFLERLTGRPVLGPVVSLVSTAEARRNRYLNAGYVVFVVILLAVYFMSVMFEQGLSSGLRASLSTVSSLTGGAT